MLKTLIAKLAASGAVGASALVLAAAPVSAASSLSASSTVTVGVGGSATVTGTAACGTDYSGVIDVQLEEIGGINGSAKVGVGATAITCDGALHNWSVVVPTSHQGPFTAPGSGFVVAQMPATTGLLNNLNALTDQHGVTFQ